WGAPGGAAPARLQRTCIPRTPTHAHRLGSVGGVWGDATATLERHTCAVHLTYRCSKFTFLVRTERSRAPFQSPRVRRVAGVPRERVCHAGPPLARTSQGRARELDWTAWTKTRTSSGAAERVIAR